MDAHISLIFRTNTPRPDPCDRFRCGPRVRDLTTDECEGAGALKRPSSMPDGQHAMSHAVCLNRHAQPCPTEQPILNARKCTLLPCEDDGRGTATPARPLAASPRPCTNQHAAGLLQLRARAPRTLKEQSSRHCIDQLRCGFKPDTCRQVARIRFVMASRSVGLPVSASLLRKIRILCYETLKPRKD